MLVEIVHFGSISFEWQGLWGAKFTKTAGATVDYLDNILLKQLGSISSKLCELDPRSLFNGTVFPLYLQLYLFFAPQYFVANDVLYFIQGLFWVRVIVIVILVLTLAFHLLIPILLPITFLVSSILTPTVFWRHQRHALLTGLLTIDSLLPLAHNMLFQRPLHYKRLSTPQLLKLRHRTILGPALIPALPRLRPIRSPTLPYLPAPLTRRPIQLPPPATLPISSPVALLHVLLIAPTDCLQTSSFLGSRILLLHLHHLRPLPLSPPLYLDWCLAAWGARGLLGGSQ